MNSATLERRVKIILLGDSGVGKTTFLESFKNETSPLKPRPRSTTIGPEYVNHNFVMNNMVLKAKIWDTAGQEVFRAINKNYYKDARGVLIFVDLSVCMSKDTLEYWYGEFRDNTDGEAEIFIVGNKSDLPKEEKNVDILTDFSAEKKVPFYEVSAHTGSNVEMTMQSLVSCIYDKYFQGGDTQDDSMETVQKRAETRNSVFLDDRTARFSLAKKEHNSRCCV